MARTKPRLYLAGPLFNEGERRFKVKLCSVLSERYDVYIPHIDGLLLPNLIESGLSIKDAYRKIFVADLNAINLCNVFFIILNGRVIDEGAAFELGVAWNLGKICLGYKDDFRQLTSVGDNPMVAVALSNVFSSIKDVERWVKVSNHESLPTH